jgi:SAM-dependent methyltransferase
MFCGMHAPEAGTDARDLTGDRDIEWSYVSARVGRYAGPGRNVLDFGAGSGFLTMAAACAGADVLAVDLMPRQFPLSYPSIRFRQTDVMSLNEAEQRFDVIMNCSTIEHVGLAGRYGASERLDGDIEAMLKLRRLLKPDGLMILTLPVGRDQVIFPLHRVYGRERLPRLLDGCRTIEETYFKKGRANDWHLCSREQALDETATERYYALGTMVLRHGTDG